MLIVPNDISPSISEIIKPNSSGGGLYLGNYQAVRN